MRIFLASTFSVMSNEQREQFIKEGKPKYILETFFNGPQKCLMAMNDTTPSDFLLDSGAFSFMSGAKATKQIIESYAMRYAQFIKENGIPYYFELDVDTIFGIDFVEGLRKELEQETKRPCIPVWHKCRGVEYWKKMVREYQYVAIGGIVSHVKIQELPSIKKMVDYAAASNVKVHGLGFTVTKELGNWKFYSVDSTSWAKGASIGAQRYDFRGKRMVVHKIGKNGEKVLSGKLAVWNGIEWCKYQRYMDRRGYWK